MFKNFILLIDQAIVSGSNFILMILFAKHLGLVSFGKFGLVFFYTFLITMIVQSIVSTTLAINFHKYKINQKQYVYYAMFKFILALSLGITLFQILLFLEVFSFSNILFPSLFILSYVTIEFVRKYFNVSFRYYKTLFFDTLFYSTIFFILLYKDFNINLDDVFLAYFIAFLLLVVCIISIHIKSFFGFFFQKISNMKVFFKEEKQQLKNLLVSSVIQWSNSRIVFYLLAFLHGPSSVGIVHAYTSLMGFLNPILISLDNFVLPRVSHKFHSQETLFAIKSYVDNIINKVAIIFIVIFIIFIAFKDFIILKTIGSEYLQYNFLLYFFFLINLYALLIKKYLYLTYITKLEKFILYNNIVILFIVLVASYPLIKLFSFIGLVVILSLIAILNFYLLKHKLLGELRL